MGKRYYSIDTMKILASFLVVCIHVPFSGMEGELLKTFARISVPFFFMVSGFFMPNKKTLNFENKIKLKIKNIFTLVILTNLGYFFLNLLISINKGNNVHDYFFDVFSKTNLLKLFVFNVSPFSEHLWYIWAYLYVLIFYYFITKFNLLGISFYFIPILLATDLVFGKYTLLILGFELPYYVVRNFLFVGIPFFLIGILFKRNMNIVKRNNKLIIILIIISFVLTLTEEYLLTKMGVSATREHYLGTTLMTIFIFLFLIENKNITKGTFLPNLGDKYSLYVYIIHPAIIILFPNAIAQNAFFVFAISLVLSFLYRKGKLIYKRKTNQL